MKTIGTILGFFRRFLASSFLASFLSMRKNANKRLSSNQKSTIGFINKNILHEL